VNDSSSAKKKRRKRKRIRWIVLVISDYSVKFFCAIDKLINARSPLRFQWTFLSHRLHERVSRYRFSGVARYLPFLHRTLMSITIQHSTLKFVSWKKTNVTKEQSRNNKRIIMLYFFINYIYKKMHFMKITLLWKL